MNKYTLQARTYPAILTILPVLVFSHFYLYRIIPELFDSILITKITGDVCLASVLLYFISQINRYISKRFLQANLFKNELYFPTTEYLLYSNNHFTTQKKNLLREKIQNDFSIELLNEKQESENETSARKLINEAVGLIRNKVKDGRLLIQHNTEYGFVRNLIGGTVIAIPFAIFNIHFFLYQKNYIALYISIVLLLVYLMVDLLHKPILRHYAHDYANYLFIEYLDKNTKEIK